MMKKLLRAELENFQGHAHTVIDFSDGVTVLCGETNNGKTAILRGLTWLLTNRPNGIGFVSHWAKTARQNGTLQVATGKKCMVKVSFTTDDGSTHEVSRIRSATDNKYVVDGTELSAIGSDVPEEVSSLLGIKAVNRQSQDDGYFFLTLTAGQMAASLNELVHLDTIDEAYGYAHRRKVETNVLYKEAEIARSEAKMKLNGLKHIPQMRSLYNEAKELGVAIDERTEALEGITDLLDNLAAVHRALDDTLPDVQKKLTRMKALTEELEEAHKVQGETLEYLRRVERAQQACIDLPEISESLVHEMQDLIISLRKGLDESEAVDGMMNDWDRMEQALARCNEELEGLKEELPDICPLCGAKIGDCRHD